MAPLVPRGILFCRFDSYGDLALFSPVLRLLHEKWPECRLGLLVREGYEDFANLLPPWVEWLGISINPYCDRPESGLKAAEEFLDQMCDFDPSIVVSCSFQLNWLDVIVAQAFPETRHVCMSLELADPAFHDELKRCRGIESGSSFDECVDVGRDVHEWEKGLKLAEFLAGEKLPRRTPALDLSDTDRIWAQDWLARNDLSDRPWVACCPAGTSNVPLKVWPGRGFGKVLRHLFRKHGFPALVLGHEEEKAQLAELGRTLENDDVPFRIWTGEDGEISRLAALLSLGHIYLGNDTGAIHLASAMGVPVVGVYGGGTWPRFKPVNSQQCVIVQPLACFGCGWRCIFATAPCIRDISTELVAEGADILVEAMARGEAVNKELAYDGEIQSFGSFDAFARHHHLNLVHSWQEKEAVIQSQLKRIAELESELMRDSDS